MRAGHLTATIMHEVTMCGLRAAMAHVMKCEKDMIATLDKLRDAKLFLEKWSALSEQCAQSRASYMNVLPAKKLQR